MPNLADSLQCKNFVTMLEKCEKTRFPLDTWESRFVADLREHFDERETQIDLSIPVWNPSADQWNTLKLIAEKC